MTDIDLGGKRKRKPVVKMDNDCTPAPVNTRHRILTVGDGDLTLSLALARAYGNEHLDLVASSLLPSSQELIETYSNASDVLRELEERNVPVLFGVDATNLTDTAGSDEEWDAILFHHPHLAGSIIDEQAHAYRHYVLLAHYFSSAKSCLRPNGVVHVCLCGRQPQTWRVVEAAQRQGLSLAMEASTSIPVDRWLSLGTTAAPVLSHYPAPRRYRNGKLGSKHFLGRYGYRHRRTHGEQVRGDADVNVSGSVHFIFEVDDSNGCFRREQVSETDCNVCETKFETVHELRQHCEAPALPDPMEVESDSNVCKSEGTCGHVDDNIAPKSTCAAINQSLDDDGDSKIQDPNKTSSSPQNMIDTSNILPSIIGDDHDGKRLKWYLRHVFAEDACLSKQKCERIIKGRRVALNGTVVVDSGRFLHTGDKFLVLPEPVGSEETVPGSAAKEHVGIYHQSDNLVVAFKPVGMRTIGSFSEQTLEMLVSARKGVPFKAVSKLDTGCAGLCVLKRDGVAVEVSHVFTALVHGHVPDSWNGLSLQLPIESMRRWRKGGNTERLDGSYVETLVHEMTAQAIGDSAEIFVLAQTQSENETLALSTVQISTSSNAGGLCNAISFLLRKRGHSVVNDRLCRREYLTLPRSIRNLIKNRLCIGCYEVRMGVGSDEQVTTVTIPVPHRLHATHWQKYCEADSE